MPNCCRIDKRWASGSARRQHHSPYLRQRYPGDIKASALQLSNSAPNTRALQESLHATLRII